jgi:NTE family protein
VFEMTDNQVRSLRKRQLIDSFKANETDAAFRRGAYWGIRTDIKDYELADSLDCPFERTLALAETPTRLARMNGDLQERLINWGYGVCDAALRKHVDTTIAQGAFPYPAAGV